MINSAVIYWLQEMGQGPEADAEVFTDVLMAIADRRNLVSGPLRPILLHQAVAKNYQLRQAARQLLTEAGITLPIPVSTPLPTAYSLRIKGSQFSSPTRLAGQNSEKAFSSPQDLVRPYGALIDRLAEQANLDSSALCYRTLAIRDEVSGANESNDEKLVKNLHDANVKYALISLRTAAIRRALMHLVTELLDVGAITEQWAASNLPEHDCVPASFPEAPKPDFIHSLKRYQASHVASGWVEAVASSPLLLQQELRIYPPDWTVIGEYSLVRSLNWGTATETYRAHLANDQLIQDETEDEIFEVIFNQLTSAYYTLDELNLRSLVVRHRPYLHYPLKSWWLAFNPALGRHLGWQPAPDHLFGWQDREGNLFIKSVYWVNGNVEMSPPRLESEAGEGWLVLASANALAQLQKLAGSLSVEKRLTRSHWRQEEQAHAEESASDRQAYSDTGI